MIAPTIDLRVLKPCGAAFFLQSSASLLEFRLLRECDEILLEIEGRNEIKIIFLLKVVKVKYSDVKAHVVDSRILSKIISLPHCTSKLICIEFVLKLGDSDTSLHFVGCKSSH